MQKFVQSIFAILNQIPNINRYVIAYSGGIDSRVLLHVLWSHRHNLPALKAVHINHGLNKQAPVWVEHCRTVCKESAIEFEMIAVDAKSAKGDSPEETARLMRYNALTGCVHDHECLLTAHHQDDQAETVLLQLLRGGGPRGLAAMPHHTKFSSGYLARPLLDVTREQVHRYAEQNNLQWIDDISNQNPAFDRNFLRLHVMPLIRERWPSFSKTMSRSAQLCADAAVILEDSGQNDFQKVQGDRADILDIAALNRLSAIRQRNVLRYWLKQLHLPCPSQKHVNQIAQQALHGGDSSHVLVTWGDADIRRYQNKLYAMRHRQHYEARIHGWDLNKTLHIQGVGAIYAHLTQGQGLDPERVKHRSLQIRFRQGGESCRLTGHKHTYSLKKLFQQWKVMPWMRSRIPLIYIGDQLAAIAGFAICEGFQVNSDKQGWKVLCDYEYPPV